MKLFYLLILLVLCACAPKPIVQTEQQMATDACITAGGIMLITEFNPVRFICTFEIKEIENE